MTLKSCHTMRQKMKNELVSVHVRSKKFWGKKNKEIVGVASLGACSVHADWLAAVVGSHPRQVFVVLSVDAVLYVNTYFTVTSLITVCASLCLSVCPSVRPSLLILFVITSVTLTPLKSSRRVARWEWTPEIWALAHYTVWPFLLTTIIQLCDVLSVLCWPDLSVHWMQACSLPSLKPVQLMYCRTASLCLPVWACRNRFILLGCLLRLGLCVLWNGSDVWRRGGRCELPSFC